MEETNTAYHEDLGPVLGWQVLAQEGETGLWNGC